MNLKHISRSIRYSSRKINFKNTRFRRVQGRGFNRINILIIGLIVILIALLAKAASPSGNTVKINISNLQAFNIPISTLSDIGTIANENNIDFIQCLTVFMLENNFFPQKTFPFTKDQLQSNFFDKYTTLYKKYNNKQIDEISLLYKALFSEITYFPIPADYDSGVDGVYMYGDSWGEMRTYGGDRTHEGTDIFDRDNMDGRISIVSMTDGTIENLGWNEKGGWRVGVRSNSGIYYYYAHLSKFRSGLQTGQKITAGTVIGTMGNTGYSKKEGVKGNFPVHLHVGIAVTSSLSKDEMWMNPYPVLRFFEGSRVNLAD